MVGSCGPVTAMYESRYIYIQKPGQEQPRWATMDVEVGTKDDVSYITRPGAWIQRLEC
jgi:hypothetical protein